MRMFGMADQLEEVDAVDAANLQVGEVLQEKINGSKRLLGADVTARGHDEVGLLPGIGAELGPDADTLGAMLHGTVHGEILQMILLV